MTDPRLASINGLRHGVSGNHQTGPLQEVRKYRHVLGSNHHTTCEFCRGRLIPGNRVINACVRDEHNTEFWVLLCRDYRACMLRWSMS